MLRWEAVSDAAPDLALAIREHFEGRRHKVLATLRRDGSPRLTGIETTFSDGEVWLGFMPGSRKGTDLRRDPRCSLLSQGWLGLAVRLALREVLRLPSEHVGDVGERLHGVCACQLVFTGRVALHRVEVETAVGAEHVELFRQGGTFTP